MDVLSAVYDVNRIKIRSILQQNNFSSHIETRKHKLTVRSSLTTAIQWIKYTKVMENTDLSPQINIVSNWSSPGLNLVIHFYLSMWMLLRIF